MPKTKVRKCRNNQLNYEDDGTQYLYNPIIKDGILETIYQEMPQRQADSHRAQPDQHHKNDLCGHNAAIPSPSYILHRVDHRQPAPLRPSSAGWTSNRASKSTSVHSGKPTTLR